MCFISAFFLGTSAAQAVAADDVVAQCPTEVSESVCQSIPTTMQQHIEEGAVTSGRGQGKISGKRIMYAGAAWYKYNRQVYNTVLLFSFSQLYENMKSNKDPPVLTSVLCTESLIVSSVVLRNDHEFKLHACMLHEFAVYCVAVVKVLNQTIIITVSSLNIQ